VLQRVNIPQYLRRVADIALEQSTSFIPSFKGDFIRFQSVTGVCQGCPISPLLYIIIVDLLVRSLTEVDDVIAVGSYADDNGVILSSRAALSKIRTRIRWYEKAVGAQLNERKCSIITNIKGFTKPKAWDETSIVDNAKYLGVVIGTKVSDIDIWGEVLIKAKYVSTQIKKVKCGFKERVYLVNTYLIPVISYLSQFHLMTSNVAGQLWNSVRASLGVSGKMGNRALAARIGPFNLCPSVRDPYICNVASLLSGMPNENPNVNYHPLCYSAQRELAIRVLRKEITHFEGYRVILDNFIYIDKYKAMVDQVKRKNLTGWIYDIIINCDRPILPTKLLKELDADREINAIYMSRNASFNGKLLSKNNYIQLIHKAWNVKSKLKTLRVTDDEECCYCNSGPQTHVHLIRDCVLAKWIYAMNRRNSIWPKCPVDLLMADRLLSRKEVEVRLKIINVLKHCVSKIKSYEQACNIIKEEVYKITERREGNSANKECKPNGKAPSTRFEHVLRFDGSANPGLMNGGYGFAIFHSEEEICCDAGPVGLANVNQAEVCALEKGICRALEIGIKKLSVVGDSKFAVGLGTKGGMCSNPKYLAPFCRIQQMINLFNDYEILFAPRQFNGRVDVLAFTGCNSLENINMVKSDINSVRPMNTCKSVHHFSVRVPNVYCQRYFAIKNPLDGKKIIDFPSARKL
jgi:hypothetical protein